MKENWKDIKNYENLYKISNFGRIKRENKILHPSLNGAKYYVIQLSKNGKVKMFFIHRLVADAFLPNPFNLPCVNHKDENTTNNSVENLEWCTYKYNTNYGTAKERRLKTFRKNSKLSVPVRQYDKYGNHIKDWKGLSYVKESLNIDPGSIIKVCKGQRMTAGGYTWRYLS